MTPDAFSPDPSIASSQPDEAIHHQSQRQKRKKNKGVNGGPMQLNLTSMIDVVFQLLIYFVVTSNFAIGEGVITAKLPSGPGPTSGPKPPEQPLKIIVRSAGAIGTSYRVYIESLAERPNNFTELSEMLVQLQHDPDRGLDGIYKPDNPVIIKPDGSVRWQHVVNAFNAAVKARYSNVNFAQATSPEE